MAKNYLSPYTYVCIVHKRYLAKHAVKVAYGHYPNFFAVIMNLDKGGVPKVRGQYPAIFILTELARSIKNLLNGLNEIIPCGTKRVNPGGQDRFVLLVGVANLIEIINHQVNVWCFGLTVGDNSGQRDAGQIIFRLFCLSSEIEMTQVLVL